MTQEKSAGVIVYNDGKYLLMHYTAGHWEFPKGHIDGNETPKETSIRELKEETGIQDAYFIKDFKEHIGYFFRKGKDIVHKEVEFYLAETKTKDIKIAGKEHQGYEWLPYSEALRRVTFANAKELLRKAHEKIKI